MAQKVKRYKGCCFTCSKFVRGEGMAHRRRPSDLRKLGGRKRRLSRHE